MTGPLWMPGVKRVLIPGLTGGSMYHNAPTRKFIVHSSEGNTLDGLIYHYSHGGYPPHLSWDPRSGGIVQHIPADRSAYALLDGDRYGALCVQIEVVAFAVHPFTNVSPWSALKGWPAIHAWVKSLGIPDAWPASHPLPYPESYGANGDRPLEPWLEESGYFTHSQVPNNLHGDPGAIDIHKLTPPEPPPIPPGGDEVDEAGVNKLIAAALAVTGAPNDSRVHALRWQGWWDWCHDVEVPRKTDQPYIDGWEEAAQRFPRP